jgi:T5SS/PEP-CTERM-associated repeat protein
MNLVNRKLVWLKAVVRSVALWFLACASPAPAEKLWISPVSSFWEVGTNWSGGTAPDDTAFIRITNDLTKTITIDVQTPTTNLTVQKLTLSAPPGATNTLMVQDLGPSNPLIFQTGLEMEDGAVLHLTNSSMELQLMFDHINIDGGMILDNGSIIFGDNTVTTRVGRATSGTFTINSGTVTAGIMTVGGTNQSSGTLNLNGGTLNIGSFFSLGRNPTTTGTVAIAGGQLNVPNDDTRVGDSGIGIMSVSNATLVLTNLTIGRDPAAGGTFTLQDGGSVLLSNDLSIARFAGSSGTLTVAGGLLQAPAHKIYIGREGSGQLNMTGGQVQISTLLVSANNTNSSSGVVNMSGGTLTCASNLLVGSASVSSGQFGLSGGAVTVTNTALAGLASVPNGSFTLNGGDLTVDQLRLTNSTSQFLFQSGTLRTKGSTVANGAAFVVGDGVNPATLYLDGGTHSFAGGLVISANATLAGCGTIIGTISNSGLISTNCGGGGSTAPSITTPPQNLTVTNGDSATFTVVGTGNPAPTYQWWKGSGKISGATSSAYTIASATLADQASYAVVLANSVGSITSAPAALTVLARPTITTPPTNLTVTNGSTATFTVAAAGNPAPTYQWFNGTGAIAGATASSFSIPSVTTNDAGSYSVLVSNSVGSTNSQPVTLTVYMPTVVPLTLASPSYAAGTFSFDISGPSGTNFVTLRSTNLTTWAPIKTNLSASGIVHFADTNPPSAGASYRTMLSP